VELALHEQTACIAIRDYGPGIPEEFLERVFDSFFRTQVARESDSGGVGLGLSIAKRAVQIHGGVISAHNADPGLLVVIELLTTIRGVPGSDSTPGSRLIQN
jgi:signal transduction histidine kinase